MITIQSAESALKNIYLDSVINDINTKTNPFLTMLAKNVKTVCGKEARATVRYGNEGSVSVGSEGGELPICANAKAAEIVSPLKNLYGTFQISDKAIRAAANNSGAFAALLSGEMQNLIAAAQGNLNGMLYGNGMKLLAAVDEFNFLTKTMKIPTRYRANFKAGTAVEIYTADNEKLSSANTKVESVDNDSGQVTFSGTLTPVKFDRIYVYAVDTGLELNGVDSIFRQDRLYNLNLTEHGTLRPFILSDKQHNSGELAVLDEDKLIEFFDRYEEYCQGVPADILLTHPGVRKAVFENLRDLRSNIDTTELAGGFKGFSFNGIPVYSDVKCKAGTLYALNSDSWNMHQLCDWTWLTHDDGSVLKQIDGKAGYIATLVKYADLICDKPFIQGKVTNCAK